MPRPRTFAYLAYLYGEEAAGEALVSEVDQRIARLHAVVDQHPLEHRPGVIVLSSSQAITAAGSGSTEDGVIQLAGARNLAAEPASSATRPFRSRC